MTFEYQALHYMRRLSFDGGICDGSFCRCYYSVGEISYNRDRNNNFSMGKSLWVHGHCLTAVGIAKVIIKSIDFGR